MKILNQYFGKLNNLYTKRLGCTFILALFSYFLVAIILWLVVANEPKSHVEESDEREGTMLIIGVVFFSFCVVPLVLKQKQ
ncbi:amino acid transporter [Prosthecobacter dejongeii]|uniref:Amino acid transporter n=1 Tax=Prosthecobacter dejongeii TaxID=48465 RepID=A0A7W7YLY5_9BACT|nr:amino acid transporter [Prosthecobacter dejongeii]